MSAGGRRASGGSRAATGSSIESDSDDDVQEKDDALEGVRIPGLNATLRPRNHTKQPIEEYSYSEDEILSLSDSDIEESYGVTGRARDEWLRVAQRSRQETHRAFHSSDEEYGNRRERAVQFAIEEVTARMSGRKSRNPSRPHSRTPPGPPPLRREQAREVDRDAVRLESGNESRSRNRRLGANVIQINVPSSEEDEEGENEEAVIVIEDRPIRKPKIEMPFETQERFAKEMRRYVADRVLMAAVLADMQGVDPTDRRIVDLIACAGSG
jgi:hypothetical protein